MEEIELEYRVRWYQQKFHRALVERTHDRLMAVWHRRAGKDDIIMNGIANLADTEVGTYWHCFPEYKQARKAIWNGINAHTGQRRIFDHFPPATIKRMQDDDMFLELESGSTYQLLGSDRYDATVGSGPRGVAYSEWALSNPSAWAYHSPMIRETKGWAAFITTPRGNNHAKTMFDRALTNPKWFCELLSIKETGALSTDDLAEALLEYQDLHGEDVGRALFEQEYLCSWAGAMIGAYFGAEVNNAERDGRVTDVPVDERYPVHTAWDLGKESNNPIWCFQVIPQFAPDGQWLRNVPHIVDFYRPEVDDLEAWVDWLNERGYNGRDYVPHDITHTEWGTGRSRVEMLRSLKRKPYRIARLSVEDGRTAARQTIKVARFDRARCETGIDGLKNYRREWDDELKRFKDKPVKDWAEHIGSAFRYLGLAWRDLAVEVPDTTPAKHTFQADEDGTIRSNLTFHELRERNKRLREQKYG